MEYLKIANSPIFWILCLPVGLLVLIQAYIFSKKAIQSADLVDLSKSDAKKAFKIGAVSSIGPALGVFVVMLGLMSVLGGPLSWMRLAIIGSAPAELAASSMAAKAMGVELQERGIVQVSMNMTDYTKTALYQSYEMVKMEARRYGVNVVGTEIVGLTPMAALMDVASYYLQIENFEFKQIIEARLLE